MKLRTRFSLAFAIVAALALTATGLAQPQSVLRELAQRLAGPNGTIFVGELPPENRLGLDFPLPQRTRVVGANALTGADSSSSFVALYLSSEQRVADVKTFYRQAFRELGYHSRQTYQTTGFLPSGADEPDDSLNFCLTKGDTVSDVNFTIGSRKHNTIIDAFVNAYPSTGVMGPCSGGDDYYVEPPVPTLVAPGASTTGTVENISGANQGNGGSLIILNTELEAEALLEHYAQQLELSGWREVNAVTGGAVQLVTYRFRISDEAFIGTLQVMPLDRKGRYLAQVSVVNP